MKCSMSMSSLNASTRAQKTPDMSKKLNTNRLCNSLSSKKSRRTLDRKYRRWGSTEEMMSQEEIWKSCIQSAQGVSDMDETQGKSVREFLEDYSRICDWLNSVQAERSRFADAGMLSQLADDMYRNQHIQKDMNDRGRLLAHNVPKLKEEFYWRIKHMNSQWDSLEKILLCQSSASLEHQRSENSPNQAGWDIEFVGRWLRGMENELQPLTFNVDWTPGKILAELTRHQGLQSEIESKASLVHGALRNSQSEGKVQVSRKRVDILERRWIQLRLRVLEWVEHLSRIQVKEATEQLGRVTEGNFVLKSNLDVTDEEHEPLSKYPRIGSLASVVTECVDSQSSGVEQDLKQSGINPEIIGPIEDCEAEGQGMGQSHDVESVYHSESPVPNSVIELSFDEVRRETVGDKQKTALASPQCIQLSPQVVPPVPMNISTYYFKHSDTEAEGTQSHEQRNHSGDSDCEWSVDNKNKVSEGLSQHLHEDQTVHKKWHCQKTLEYSQNFSMDSVGEYRTSPSSDLACKLNRELEEMDHQTTVAIQDLDEIEELVQKAELLVKVGRKRHRVTTGGSFRADLGSWGLGEEEVCGYLSHSKDNSTSLFKKQALSGERREEPVRGCQCRIDMEEVGAVGGFCFCESTNSPNGHKSATNAKIPRKHSRVRQWVRAHKNSIINEQKSTSSCDASGESASESESELSEGSIEDPQLSSDDPTILTASTTLLQQHPIISQGLTTSSPKRGISYSSFKSADQFSSQNGDNVVLRSKKAGDFAGKQRPRSFTDNSTSSQLKGCSNGNGHSGFGFERLRFGKVLSPIHDLNQRGTSVFVSDSALNYIEQCEDDSCTGSPEESNLTSDASGKERRKGKCRKRLLKQKKRASLDVDLDVEFEHFNCNSIIDERCFVGDFTEMEHHLEGIENTLPATLKPVFKLDQIDNLSLNTEELPTNDQDWDSYQEKYLSEPYSEEPYDQDRTLKLLAFGEDYDQVLERADSENSSALSGFQQTNSRKRRPLPLALRSEMTESDSDREEFNHFLVQSVTQLRFIESVFRKELASSSMPDFPKCAEMEATCEQNINFLNLILSNVEKPDALPFEVDIKSIQDVLNSWDLLRDRIVQAAKLQQIQADLKFLKSNFESIQRDLSLVDPFDSKDINSLKSKVERIQSVLNELTGKKEKLQSVNEESVGAQIYLKDANGDVKKQLKNLYALYEENFQLGTYLLDKMKFLEDAWASFEQERDAFEKSLALPSGIRAKGKKSLSSSASTDSGHGTDFSYSDSDIDERRKKLVALRARAFELKSFLPVGSPILDVIDTKITEAQRDFDLMEKVGHTPLDLKVIFPKRKLPASKKLGHRASKPTSNKRSASVSRLRRSSPSPIGSLRSEPSRHWRTIRFSITFHLALMGLFAVAWFLQPKCCENMNTFSFSIIPHLTHDRIPHM